MNKFELNLNKEEIEDLYKTNKEAGRKVCDEYDEHTELFLIEIAKVVKKISEKIMRVENKRIEAEDINDSSGLQEKNNDVDFSIIKEELRRYFSNEKERSRHEAVMRFYETSRVEYDKVINEYLDNYRF